MNYFIYQGNDHDCGFASLKMLMAIATKNKSFLYIPKPSKRENYSINDLMVIAHDYGVELEAYKCEEEYLNEIKTPCLAIINVNHVVVIKHLSKTRIVLYDPAVGRVSIRRDKFMKIWEKIIVEISSFIHKQFTFKQVQIIPKKFQIWQSIISLVSTTLIVLTLYLFSNASNALYSLIFIGLFASAQFIENVLLFKQIYHFDKTFIEPYFSRSDNQDKIGYLEFEGFKQSYFTQNRSLLTSIIIAFLVTFLLVVNDFRNGFVLIALILLNLLDVVLFSKGEKEKKEKIANLEARYLDDPSGSVHHIKSANFLANELVFKTKCKNVIFMILSFAFAMLMLILTGSSGCNYVIFHFGLYYIGSNACSNVISGLSGFKELEKSEARFIDKCNL